MADFRESEQLQAALLVHAGGGDARIVDFMARLCDAWDGRGNFVMTDTERRALLEHAGYRNPSIHDSCVPWANFTGEQRRRLLIGARRVIEFARLCAWTFGEGEGP